MLGLISNIIGGVSKLFGESDKTRRERDLQASKDLSAYNVNLQRDAQSQLWAQQFDATNKYNSPSAQLERLYEAGINPLTFKDFENTSSAGVGGSVSGGGSYQSSLPSGFQNAMTALQTITNTSKSLADISKLKAETDNITATTPYVADMNQAQIDKLISESKKALSDKDVNEETISQIKQNIDSIKNSINQKWKELEILSKDAETRRAAQKTNQYTSEWQNEIAHANVANDMANTRIAQSKLHFDTITKFDFEKAKFMHELSKSVMDFNLAYSKQEWEKAKTYLEKSSVGLGFSKLGLGFEWTPPKWMQRTHTNMQKFLSNPEVPDYLKLDILPKYNNTIDSLLIDLGK